MNAVSAVLSSEARRRVAALPFVAGLRPVAQGRIQSVGPRLDAEGRPLEQTLPLVVPEANGPYPYGPAYGQLAEIHVPEVHALGYTGNRVRLMMLDTGFRKDHDAFAQTALLAERDFVFGDSDTQNEPEDPGAQHNHGTGTWGVAGGYDPGHLVGSGYGATFVLAKTEDLRSETPVEEDNYVAALEWADSLGIQVTSASLIYLCFDGGFCYEGSDLDGDTAVITRALDLAAARGLLCVNAAGNMGDDPSSLGTPADADSMLAVGAVDSLGVIAGFSSRGPTADGRIKPEVVARGVSTWWADAAASDAYGPASGTSLSTPLIGGATALLLEAHPEWEAMDARQALLATADRHDLPDNDYGWGRVDVLAALQSAPIVYPTPFSLISPADGATVPNLTPTFVWRSSSDPDEGGTMEYQVWMLEGGGDKESPQFAPATVDTSLTISFPLEPETFYRWEVRARDPDGQPRMSREQFTFRTPSGASVPGAGSITDRGRLTVALRPNPSWERVEFRVVAPAEAASGLLSWSLVDPAGRRLAAGTVVGERGVFQGAWDGHSEGGDLVGPGVYYLELHLGNRAVRETMVRFPKPAG